jgi:PIN domain nuclease of toxin-antitoxin system
MATQVALNSRRFNLSFINIGSLHLLIIVKQCGVVELALTRDISLLAVEFKNRHGDAADRFIATTDIVH